MRTFRLLKITNNKNKMRERQECVSTSHLCCYSDVTLSKEQNIKRTLISFRFFLGLSIQTFQDFKDHGNHSLQPVWLSVVPLSIAVFSDVRNYFGEYNFIMINTNDCQTYKNKNQVVTTGITL